MKGKDSIRKEWHSWFGAAPAVAIMATAAALVAIAALVPARPAHAQSADVPVMNCAPATAESFLDANNVRAKILNNGGLIWNGGNPVYEVPKGAGIISLFTANIWMGGLVDGDLRTVAATYRSREMWPGPYDAIAEGEDCREFDRIYRVERRDFIALASGREPSIDVQEWPWQLGAPVVDGDGIPDNYDLSAGDRPLLLGDEMHWWIMNDIGNEHAETHTLPMGVEVQGMAFSSASTQSPHYDNTTFYVFRIKNKSEKAIEDAYFGLFVDTDLGNFTDDYVGSDSVLSLGYGYNADNNDVDGYGLNPPAIGVQITRGPVVDDAPLGLRSFVFYNGGGGVTGDPVQGSDFYNFMQGKWKDGQPITLGGGGRSFSTIPTPYMFSGDPVTRSFWSEMNVDGNGTRVAPADRRAVSSTGPFTLAPGEEAEVFLSLITAFGSDHLNSVTVLKEAAADFLGMRPDEVPFSPTSGVVPERAPRVLNVASGATGQPLDLLLRWDRVPVLDEEYEVVLESEGGSVRSWMQFGTELKPGLEPDTDYVFRLRVASDHAYGPWSEPVAFSTGSERFEATSVFTGFLAVANGAGPLSPPVGAAADFQGFPVPSRPGERQQVGMGQWMIHTYENGTARPSYEDFLNRSVFGRPNGTRFLIPNDFELRFTTEGGKAWNAFTDGSVVDVPFELWRTGVGTPDDPSDDVRLIPWILDWDGDGWGITCTDHTVSGAPNDPETDAIYWQLPSDVSPGDAGYRAWVREVEATGDGAGPAWKAEVMGRIVLVNRNGGDVTECAEPQAWDAAVPSQTGFNQDAPEEGTVFRMLTERPPAPIPSAPAGDAVVEAGPVAFYWSAFRAEGATLAVARDADFRQLLLVLDAAEPGRAQMSAVEPGTYWWRVTDGFGSVSEPVRFFVGTAVGTEGAGGSAVGGGANGDLPQEFALQAPWPNPSAGGVTVPFELPEPARVTLRVFDVLGREVATLIDRDLPAGRHEAAWDAGSGGAYIIRLEAGSFTRSRVVTVM